ncbi:MAG TPA: thioredoxin domain-containing protein [Bacteroidales bacterium]|nr:thioredoxin domain-containing protein [Bacteroidales bacterium]
MNINKFIIILTFASFSVYGCNNTQAENSKSNDAPEEVAAKKSISKAPKASGSTIQLTKSDFLEKIMNYEKNPNEWQYLGDKPALIDFYADWCGPCKIAAPVLEELASEYKDEIYIYKVDTEVERELAGVFGIKSIPSFLFIPEEGRPTMSNGIAQTPEETKKMFKQMIDELLLDKGGEETL